eukprot:jgi/Botrbrau1/7428/Bobra.0083s0001.1
MATGIACQTVETKPFEGQKPGTSGLRKKVKVFAEEHYLANFVQSVFDALPETELAGSTIVVSGDGRYYSKEAIQIIVRMAAANGVGTVWVGKDGLMSTPAVSAVIRNRQGGKAYGGFILSASHNPGGPDEDFGIKYNTQNGGPAPEKLTDQVYENTKKISKYHIVGDALQVDISKLGTSKFMVQHAHTQKFGNFVVEVIDPVEDYLKLMKTIYDFQGLQRLLKRPDFSFVFDGMHGVAGPYARRIFVQELGADAQQLTKLRASGGLWRRFLDQVPAFGAACDGDADRNMILGARFFVTPSDSLALIAAHAHEAIPYFRRGLKGVARSMPTSAAVDRVASEKGIQCFEVPTGWKFFGNLMDDGRCSLCGEESFGTGSDHVREKDGLWAVLGLVVNFGGMRTALAGKTGAADKLVSVEDLVKAHWAKYGRNFYTRYDYENVESEKADAVIKLLRSKQGEITQVKSFVIAKANDFSYTDPVDGSVSQEPGPALPL